VHVNHCYHTCNFRHVSLYIHALRGRFRSPSTSHPHKMRLGVERLVQQHLRGRSLGACRWSSSRASSSTSVAAMRGLPQCARAAPLHHHRAQAPSVHAASRRLRVVSAQLLSTSTAKVDAGTRLPCRGARARVPQWLTRSHAPTPPNPPRPLNHRNTWPQPPPTAPRRRQAAAAPTSSRPPRSCRSWTPPRSPPCPSRRTGS